MQTPAYPDKNYLYYQNAQGTTNNPIADYTTSGFDEILYGRGASPIQILSVVHSVSTVIGTVTATDTSLVSTQEIGRAHV